MTVYRRLAALVTAVVIGSGGAAPALAAGTNQSSAGSAYGGMGTQVTAISPTSTGPTSSTTAPSTSTTSTTTPSTSAPSTTATTSTPSTTTPSTTTPSTQQTQQPVTPTQVTQSGGLPFTGLDVGLLVLAGLILTAAGVALRWRLRHGGQ